MLHSSGQIFAFFILQGDVWICMELMDTSLDKFYKHVIDKGLTIPEDILGKIAVSVSISRARGISLLNQGVRDPVSLLYWHWEEHGPRASPCEHS